MSADQVSQQTVAWAAIDEQLVRVADLFASLTPAQWGAAFDAVRTDGVRYVACDAEWESGEGRTVEGSVADLLLLLSGRGHEL